MTRAQKSGWWRSRVVLSALRFLKLGNRAKMPPKRKAAAKKAPAAKKAKVAEPVEPPAPSPTTTKAKGKSPKKASPKKASPPAPPLDEYAALWANAEFVEGGAMGQAGFAAFCTHIGLEELSFEACYLMHLLTPKIDDVMVVCPSEEGFRAVVERRLRCARPADVAAKLRAKRAEFISDAYGNGVEGHEFTLYYKWLYDVGRAIAAANNGVSAEQVRSVPAAEAVMFLRAGLAGWPYMEKLAAFCDEAKVPPFSKDLWDQLGRFAMLTTCRVIAADLSNYEECGGGAWPCMIDDFVEWHEKQAP